MFMKKYIYFILPMILTVLILNGCKTINNNANDYSLELTELNYDDIIKAQRCYEKIKENHREVFLTRTI